MILYICCVKEVYRVHFVKFHWRFRASCQDLDQVFQFINEHHPYERIWYFYIIPETFAYELRTHIQFRNILCYPFLCYIFSWPTHPYWSRLKIKKLKLFLNYFWSYWGRRSRNAIFEPTYFRRDNTLQTHDLSKEVGDNLSKLSNCTVGKLIVQHILMYLILRCFW